MPFVEKWEFKNRSDKPYVSEAALQRRVIEENKKKLQALVADRAPEPEYIRPKIELHIRGERDFREIARGRKAYFKKLNEWLEPMFKQDNLSNLSHIKLLLGPALYPLQREYNQKIYNLLWRWVDNEKESIFYETVSQTLRWYFRSEHDVKTLEHYEKTVISSMRRQIQQDKESSPDEVSLSDDNQDALISKQQTLAKFARIKAVIDTQRKQDIYHFVKFMNSQEDNEIGKFLKELRDNHPIELEVELKEKKYALTTLMHAAFNRHPDDETIARLMKPLRMVFSGKVATQSDVTGEHPSSSIHAETIAAHSSTPQSQSVSGQARLDHNAAQDILPSQYCAYVADDSLKKIWLARFKKLIDNKTYVMWLYEDVIGELKTCRKRANALIESQKNLCASYKRCCHRALERYKSESRAFLQANQAALQQLNYLGDTPDAEIDSIIKLGIGAASLREDIDSEKLKKILEKCHDTNTTNHQQWLKLADLLIARNCMHAHIAATNVRPIQKPGEQSESGNIPKPGQTAVEWYLLELEYAQTVATTPLLEKCRQEMLAYCDKSKGEVASWLWRLFHKLEIKSERYQAAQSLLRVVQDASAQSDETRMIATIKQGKQTASTGTLGGCRLFGNLNTVVVDAYKQNQFIASAVRAIELTRVDTQSGPRLFDGANAPTLPFPSVGNEQNLHDESDEETEQELASLLKKRYN